MAKIALSHASEAAVMAECALRLEPWAAGFSVGRQASLVRASTGHRWAGGFAKYLVYLALAVGKLRLLFGHPIDDQSEQQALVCGRAGPVVRHTRPWCPECWALVGGRARPPTRHNRLRSTPDRGRLFLVSGCVLRLTPARHSGHGALGCRSGWPTERQRST